MAFSPVPSESRTQINRAGETLARLGKSANRLWKLSSKDRDDFNRAWDLASRWRACHAYPINTFQATLRTKIKRGYSPQSTIAAQRLKRMPTIIDKLTRYPHMKLTRMQDIVGVRAVLSAAEQAEKLAREYRGSRLSHDLIVQRDYTSNPRDEDGYRSIHLIYRYKNRRNPAYDGLRLELQIRSLLQHTWATAVETMGTLLGQALKSRQGDQAWIDFFAITSSAFAHLEERPRLPRFSHLSKEETFRSVAEAERQLTALEMMRGISIVAQTLPIAKRPYYYHLLVLDSLKHEIRVMTYGRDRLEDAVSEYGEV